MPQSPFKNTVIVWSVTFCVDMRDRPPGESFPEPTQRAEARCRAAHPNPERSGVGPERALEANTQPPRATRESSSSPEPTQRAQA